MYYFIKWCEFVIDFYMYLLVVYFRCKNMSIGGLFIWGVLGGEWKCISIGYEIFVEFLLFFLDELIFGFDFVIVFKIFNVL